MRFIEITQPGAPNVMRVGEMDQPKPKAGEVLIKVAAAGVNRPDVVQRQGLYPPPPGASPVLGLEVAGEIVELGEGVDASQLNRQVCALTNGGGYADYVAVPLGQCLPIPHGLNILEAAALPETFFTVWVNLFMRAHFSSGESVLVHGGSSGIGYTAIQMAKAFNGKVFTTAGSEEKCKFCRDQGADVAINYREEDFVEKVMQATDDRGVDVVLDMVGGDYIQKNIQVAAVDGRIVNVAHLGGSKATVNFLPVMIKRLVLTGSTLRPRNAEVKAEIATQLQENIWPFLEAGKIKVSVYKSFDFDDVVAAHQLMESSQHMGKIVLQLT